MAAGATLGGGRAEAEGRWRGTSGSLVIRPPFPRDGTAGLIKGSPPHRHICCEDSSHLGHLLATAALLSFTANRFLQRFLVPLRFWGPGSAADVSTIVHAGKRKKSKVQPFSFRRILCTGVGGPEPNLGRERECAALVPASPHRHTQLHNINSET